MSGRISEVCSCGARFEYNGDYPGIAAGAWRQEHRHDRPARDVGRCASVAPRIDLAEGAACYCSLDFGHTGSHHDEDSGSYWIELPPKVDVEHAERLGKALLDVRIRAARHATNAKMHGDYEESRRWLDLLAVLDDVDADDRDSRTPDTTERTTS